MKKMNYTPLRKQVGSAVADLRKAADEIESNFNLLATAGEREEMIQEARDQIERSKASGHRWQLWQKLVDEFEFGSEDIRGTENDQLRELATFLDALPETAIRAYHRYSTSWHPTSADDAVEVISTMNDLRWGYQRLNSDTAMFKTHVPNLDLELTVFVKPAWAQSVAEMVNALRPEVAA